MPRPTLHDITLALASTTLKDDTEGAKDLARQVLAIYDIVEKRERVQRAARDLLDALRETVPLLVLLGDYVGNTTPDGTDRCAVLSRARCALRLATGGSEGA